MTRGFAVSSSTAELSAVRICAEQLLQHHWVNRLGEEVGAPGIERHFSVLLRRKRGYGNETGVLEAWLPLQLLNEFAPVEVWQPDIEQYHVGAETSGDI